MSEIFCRVCNGKGHFDGLLFKCSSCSAVHWDKIKVKKLFNKIKKNTDEWSNLKKEILLDARIPKFEGHYVYTLRLRSKHKYLYVGMTGLHPYERFLNHLIGYKSSKFAKRFATALIEFEGPMKYEIARDEREKGRANEYRAEGFEVEGAPF